MRFGKFSLGLLAVYALSGLSTVHAQTPAVTLMPAPVHTFNNRVGYTLGFEFTTNSSIVVSSLGYFTIGTLTESHDIGLYTSLGTLLASTTVTGNTPVTGNFAYASIAPLTLTAGGDYVIGGTSGFVDVYTSDPTTFATDPSINFIQSRFAGGNTLAFSTFHNGVTGFFGASFQIGASAVPEPGSVALLVGMGISGAGMMLRRRRK